MSWTLRSYKWKGESFVAVYWGNKRLGFLKADETCIDEMATKLLAHRIDVGEARNAPVITRTQSHGH